MTPNLLKRPLLLLKNLRFSGSYNINFCLPSDINWSNSSVGVDESTWSMKNSTKWSRVRFKSSVSMSGVNNFYTFICFNDRFLWFYNFEKFSDILGIFRIKASNFSHFVLSNPPNNEFLKKMFQKTDVLIISLNWWIIYAYKYVLIKFDRSR